MKNKIYTRFKRARVGENPTGHSSGYNTDEGIDISVAGKGGKTITGSSNSTIAREFRYLRRNFIPGSGRHYRNDSKVGWKIHLHNVNKKILDRMSNNIAGEIGLYGLGKLKYGFLFGCQSHVGRSLWAVGIPTLPINFHPWVLNTQLFVRQVGINASPMFQNKIIAY